VPVGGTAASWESPGAGSTEPLGTPAPLAAELGRRLAAEELARMASVARRSSSTECARRHARSLHLPVLCHVVHRRGCHL